VYILDHDEGRRDEGREGGREERRKGGKSACRTNNKKAKLECRSCFGGMLTSTHLLSADRSIVLFPLSSFLSSFPVVVLFHTGLYSSLHSCPLPRFLLFFCGCHYLMFLSVGSLVSCEWW